MRMASIPVIWTTETSYNQVTTSRIFWLRSGMAVKKPAVAHLIGNRITCGGIGTERAESVWTMFEQSWFYGRNWLNQLLKACLWSIHVQFNRKMVGICHHHLDASVMRFRNQTLYLRLFRNVIYLIIISSGAVLRGEEPIGSRYFPAGVNHKAVIPKSPAQSRCFPIRAKPPPWRAFGF